MLTVKEIGKLYNGRTIFSGISGQVSEGQVLVVAGHNGSGKSTLLRILCGLVSPNTGQVVWRFKGRELTPKDAIHQLGYVSPDMGLHDRLTASEHLQFFADLRRIRHHGAWVADRLREVQLADYAEIEVGKFSSGMRQRLKLACALVHDPVALVLDEPSSNLDAEGVDLLSLIISRQRSRGVVVMATNEEREVARYGQAVIRMGKFASTNQERPR